MPCLHALMALSISLAGCTVGEQAVAEVQAAAADGQQASSINALRTAMSEAAKTSELVDETSERPTCNVAPILVTGATGPTGRILYKLLQERGFCVRAFVRNATKAKEVLGCDKCDISEGIYMGDVTKEDPLALAARGAAALAITGGTLPVGGGGGPPAYADGAYPKDVDWVGGINQVKSFNKANGGHGGHVVLLSTMGTTDPESPLDKFADGYMSHWKMNFEVFLMASGLPWTIIKACGLQDTPSGVSELVVGHHDLISAQIKADSAEGGSIISRGDVARVLFEALVSPTLATGLRMDVCSKPGPATTDFSKLLASARTAPW